MSDRRNDNKEKAQEFSYIAAHDLKTPLRGIATLADWISNDYADKLGEEGRKQVNLLLGRTKIFRIFQTLSPREQTENTGIGLAIVKKIVELNVGNVWVESEVGKGSTFYFTLPMHMKAPRTQSRPAHTAC